MSMLYIFSIAHFDVGLIPCARGGNKNLLGQAELVGLGIMDLNLFGYALRMRWLWFKKTDAARPWARLPVVTESVVIDMFNASVSVEIGNGHLHWANGNLWSPVSKENTCAREMQILHLADHCFFAGRPRDGRGTIYKMMTRVHFAPRSRKQSHICYLIAVSLEKSGIGRYLC